MTGHASVNAIDIGEIDVVVQPGEDDLLDLKVGQHEIHQRSVENKVVDLLVKSGESRL